ncbi:MAG: vWA domain-containing protein [Cyclobacteriaceae bacterium]
MTTTIKYLIIFLSVFLFCQKASSQVFVHSVNCPSSGCVSCADCSLHGFEVTTACLPIDDLTSPEGQCGADACFSELNITTLDFTPSTCDHIELGLSIKRRIRIFAFQEVLGETNIGVNIRLTSLLGGAENFTIQNITAGTPAVTGSSDIVNFSNGNEIEVTYLPVSSGTHNVQLSINQEDACPTSITLSGTTKVASSKSFVLALDRSGSMNQGVGSGSDRKIDRLVTASEMFLGLLALEGGAHQFGLVAYNNTTSTYNSTLSDLSLIGDATANFIDATNPGDPIYPIGATGIGGAIVEAMGLLNGGDPGECSPPNPAFAPDNKVIVLLTDGKENRSPFVDPASSPSLSEACIDQATIYTIGFGEAGDFNEMLLQDLPIRSEFDCVPRAGYIHVDTDLSDLMDQDDLNEAYAKIFFANFDYSEIIDPTILVNIADGSEKLLFTANVTTSDKKAIFITYDDPAKKRLYKLKLFSPDGNEVVNGSFGNNLSAKIIEGEGYTLYKVDFKDDATSSFAGRWDLKIFPNPQLAARFSSAQDSLQSYRQDSLLVSIGFNSSAVSNLNMEVFALSTGGSSGNQSTAGFVSNQVPKNQPNTTNANQLPGSEILIALKGTESGLPAKINSIYSSVRAPNGTVYPVQISNDQNGFYKGKFSNTFLTGTYKVFVRAILENSKGEVTTRESTRYVALGKPDAPIQDESCISCTIIKILIVVAILVLILILVLVMRRKSQ